MSSKVKIKLVRLGCIKRDVDFTRIVSWSSSVFNIKNQVESIKLLPNSYDDDYGTYENVFKKEMLLGILSHDDDYDITIGIIDYQIEDNFYLKRLSDNRAVISLYEIFDILENNEVPIENFILKCIYEITSIYQFGRKKSIVGGKIEELVHGETRRCLFDMNGDKSDVMFSTVDIHICECCKAELMKRSITNEEIMMYEKELKRIKLPLYVKIKRFFKKYTKTAIVISFIITALSSTLGAFIYDLIKNIMGN